MSLRIEARRSPDLGVLGVFFALLVVGAIAVLLSDLLSCLTGLV